MLSTVRSRPVVVFATLVIALVLVGWWKFTRPDGSQAAEVGSTETTEQTSEVTTGTMTETVAASGTIAAADTDELSFTSSGTVTAVKVEAGDQVKAGNVLARLDSVELEAAVADAQASLADAQARLDDAQDSDASDAELDAAQAAVTVARDQVDAAEQALDGATLTASIDGTVSDVSVAKGDVLGSGGADGTQLTGSGTGSGQSASTLGSGGGSALPGQAESSTTESSPHVAVTSTGSYVVELDVDATDIDAIAEGQSATITPSTSSGGFGAFPGGGFPGGGFPGGGFPGGGGPGGGDAFPGGGFPGGGAPGGGGQGGGDGQGGGQDGGAGLPGGDLPGAGLPGGASASGEVASVAGIADASSGVATYSVDVAFDGDAEQFNVGATADVDIVVNEVPDAVQVPLLAVTNDGGTSQVTVQTEDGREMRAIETGLVSGGMVQVLSGVQTGETVVYEVAAAPTGDQGSEQPFQAPGGGVGPPGGTPPDAGAAVPEGSDDGAGQ